MSGDVDRLRPLAPDPSGAARVAVLCAPARAQVAASAVALALARTTASPCALAAAVGAASAASLAATLSARRVAAALRAAGHPAAARGRLVRLGDRRCGTAEHADRLAADDAAGCAAALSVELGRAADAAAAPAAIALTCSRSDALDRVLAWHDAIVVVREPGSSEAVLRRALASLAALGRPAAAMAPPGRLAAVLAVAGLTAPAEATGAVAQLGLVRGTAP